MSERLIVFLCLFSAYAAVAILGALVTWIGGDDL